MYDNSGFNSSSSARVSALLAAPGPNGRAFKSRLFDAIAVEGPLLLVGVPNSCTVDVANYIHCSRGRSGKFIALESDASLSETAGPQDTIFVGDFQSTSSPTRSALLDKSRLGPRMILGITLDTNNSIAGKVDDLTALPCVAIPRFRDIKDDAIAVGEAFLRFLGYPESAHNMLDKAASQPIDGVGTFFDSLDIERRLSRGGVVTCGATDELLHPPDSRFSDGQKRLVVVIRSHPNPFKLSLSRKDMNSTIAELCRLSGLSNSQVRISYSIVSGLVSERRRTLLGSLVNGHSLTDLATMFDVSVPLMSNELKRYGLKPSIRYGRSSISSNHDCDIIELVK